MGTKNDPGITNCYGKAEPDEPMFILLARDKNAPQAVEAWATAREYAIKLGSKPESDLVIVKEARDCAEAMRQWRKANR